MCKLALVAGLDPKNTDLNWNFIEAMADAISIRNTDGLGYTAVKPNGDMFGERWLFNHEAFDVCSNKKGDVVDTDKILKKYNNSLTMSNKLVYIEKYNKFGSFKERDEISSITLHARFATSSRGFHNTHPFVDFDTETSIVHNGVINNVGKEDNIRSTCDSERILNKYLKYQVNINPDNISKVADALTGYYRVGAFAKDANGKRILDVFKCDTYGGLQSGYVVELGAMVFTTDIDDLKKVCSSLQLTLAAEFKFADSTMVRLDAITGEVMLTKSFAKALPVKYEDHKFNRHRSNNYGNYMEDFTKDMRGVPVSEYNKNLEEKKLITEADLQERFDSIDKDGWDKEKDNTWIKNRKIK